MKDLQVATEKCDFGSERSSKKNAGIQSVSQSVSILVARVPHSVNHLQDAIAPKNIAVAALIRLLCSAPNLRI